MSKVDRAVHERVIAVAQALLGHGESVGPFLPWHCSTELYQWLVAEILLRRTTRTAAAKAFADLTDSFPDWESLSRASENEVAGIIAWMGLGNQRSKQLIALAKAVKGVADQGIFCQRDRLKSLPGIGNYIADAVMLHVCNERAFPLDSNVQRVTRRVLGFPTPVGTRHSDPYQDAWVIKSANWLLEVYTASELRDIHRGMLLIAWEQCRPRAKCATCPLADLCKYAAVSH